MIFYVFVRKFFCLYNNVELAIICLFYWLFLVLIVSEVSFIEIELLKIGIKKRNHKKLSNFDQRLGASLILPV